ncbi:MAG: 2Fe-2S iron-sulfur cluster binding domain-containing protein [Candidatus Thalassarchaeaceae archaeon]|jgi:ferredoxin|nr:2Fe-2S iron-sulfur cluster binding domain-containing protein [Candidatus Thalassarchaeaceae archaeon]
MSGPIIRFYRGSLLLGTAEAIPEHTLLEIAENAGVEISRNCTSGNCGTCMARIISGTVPLPNPLPPGLDDYLVENGAVLTCIGIPNGACDIDLTPPL